MGAPMSHLKRANKETRVSYQQVLLLWCMYLPTGPPPSPDKPVGDAETMTAPVAGPVCMLGSPIAQGNVGSSKVMNTHERDWIGSLHFALWTSAKRRGNAADMLKGVGGATLKLRLQGAHFKNQRQPMVRPTTASCKALWHKAEFPRSATKPPRTILYLLLKL
jgi:hypothetical protein